jgi:hypothetical protein
MCQFVDDPPDKTNRKCLRAVIGFMSWTAAEKEYWVVGIKVWEQEKIFLGEFLFIAYGVWEKSEKAGGD